MIIITTTLCVTTERPGTTCNRGETLNHFRTIRDNNVFHSCHDHGCDDRLDLEPSILGDCPKEMPSFDPRPKAFFNCRASILNPKLSSTLQTITLDTWDRPEEISMLISKPKTLNPDPVNVDTRGRPEELQSLDQKLNEASFKKREWEVGNQPYTQTQIES
jgi:hypothetical protein